MKSSRLADMSITRVDSPQLSGATQALDSSWEDRVQIRERSTNRTLQINRDFGLHAFQEIMFQLGNYSILVLWNITVSRFQIQSHS